MAAFFNNFRAEFKQDIDRDFGISNKNVVSMIDPAFAESPPF